MSRAPMTDLGAGALAWWQVRDPLLTPQQPTRLPVRILVATHKGALVEVERGGLSDPDRPPGYRATVQHRKLTPRTPESREAP